MKQTRDGCDCGPQGSTGSGGWVREAALPPHTEPQASLQTKRGQEASLSPQGQGCLSPRLPVPTATWVGGAKSALSRRTPKSLPHVSLSAWRLQPGKRRKASCHSLSPSRGVLKTEDGNFNLFCFLSRAVKREAVLQDRGSGAHSVLWGHDVPLTRVLRAEGWKGLTSHTGAAFRVPGFPQYSTGRSAPLRYPSWAGAVPLPW